MLPFIWVDLDGVFGAPDQQPVHGVQGPDRPRRQVVIGIGGLGGLLRVEEPLFGPGILVEQVTGVPIGHLGEELLPE